MVSCLLSGPGRYVWSSSTFHNRPVVFVPRMLCLWGACAHYGCMSIFYRSVLRMGTSRLHEPSSYSYVIFVPRVSYLYATGEHCDYQCCISYSFHSIVTGVVSEYNRSICVRLISRSFTVNYTRLRKYYFSMPFQSMDMHEWALLGYCVIPMG